MSTHDSVAAAAVRPSVRGPAGRRREIWLDATMRRFLLSQGAGQFADALTAMIVARVVLSTSTETLDAGALLRTLIVAIGPYAVIGPLAGIVADHWDRRLALGATNLARTLATLLALVAVRTHDHVLGLVVAGILISLARIVFTLRAASVPAAAPAGLLVRADATSLYVGMTAAVLGGSLGALGAPQIPSLLLVVAAGAQLASGVGFLSLSCDLGGRSVRARRPIARSARRVIAATGSTPIRQTILVTATHRALLGATFVSAVVLIGETLGPARSYAAALAITGVGTFVGATSAPGWCERLGAARLVLVVFALPAIVLPAAARGGWSAPIGVAVAATFLVFQHLRVAADATVQSSAVDEVRGRVFSVYDAAYNVSYLGGAALAIVLGADADPRLALGVVGGAYAITAVYVAVTDIPLRPLLHLPPPHARRLP